MAEIDINNLGDAAAIADTDDILAIINGLGKNLNWAKLKEQLVKELPVVTEYSNGLMDRSDYKKIFSIDMNSFPPNKKENTSFYDIGLYYILDGNGYFEVIGISAYTNMPSHVAGYKMMSDGASEGFVIKRDVNDGPIYVVNKYTTNHYFSMWKI